MDTDKLAKEREKYRNRLARAIREDPDPLAAYVDFVQWTTNAYNGHLERSGLLELLDEATRYFLDDDAYKSDLRYLKLWLLYASYVQDPTIIYSFILSKDVGKIYAQVYQEYALALHTRGKWEEADRIFQLGIRRRARPADPLKRQYEEFKARTLAPPPRVSPSDEAIWQDAPLEAQALRRNPLKNHRIAHPSAAGPSNQASSSRQSSTRPSASTSREEAQSLPADPYGHMRAPPPAGKRPEILHFNLSLLFTEDGTEYSMQEARARSMGLLGKKWGPPPEAKRPRVAFSGANEGKPDATKTLSRRFAAGAEPTVTLATKEALADVFGMYNSPEKSTRFGLVGSKHAPVKKIEPVTPMASLPHVRALSNENAIADIASKTPTFRPFVDENARRENQTPATTPKILPFVDPENAFRPAVTPNPSRPVLSLKDSMGAPPPSAKQDENARGIKGLAIYTDTDGTKPAPVFSLTPASATFRDRPHGRWDVFTDDAAKPGPRPASASAVKFMPFSDKVFSRPVPKSENAPTPGPTFTPFVEKTTPLLKPLSSSFSSRPFSDERTPLRPVLSAPPTEPEAKDESGLEEIPEDTQQRETREPDTPTTEASESDMSAREQFVLEQQHSRDRLTSESSEDADDYDDYGHSGENGYAHPADAPVPIEGSEDSMFDDYEGEQDAHSAPLGGRFGQFDVMTPITERTLEYTMNTRGGTPGGFAVHRDAVEAAVQLAAELQEDRDDDEDEGEVGQIEEQTGTLSLLDALGVASSFKPPNPCNPFDPPIMSTILRMIPPDSGFHDLRTSESQQLEALQKFAKRKTRRASGNSTSSRSLQESNTLEVQLENRHFAAVDKLGEGGFGAVFEAIDLDLSHKGDTDSDVGSDEEVEDDDKNRVALKIVKPRNLWEFHVLRRIHTTLPASLRRSIIAPQALYAFKDESFLVLELCKQGTLLNIVNRASSAGITQQGACLDELLVMFFSIELLRLLEGLHRAGFIHGDVKTDNCLLRLEDVPGPASAWDAVYQPSGAGGWAHKGIKLIDFGRTIDTRLFPAGQRYVAEWPTDARDCFEAREGRPWTFQTDYFGLAGIVFCMLYGKYIEAASVVPAPAADDAPVRYKLAAPFKRYWQGELWTRLFDLLLNPTLARPDGKLPVCDELAALREEMEVWLQANCNRASNSLKGLLKKVGLAILGGKDAR
ncbi:Mad3/BUB1 homology region 1-domain-containing protein [Lenzites betulinus]|nr:Mad3/BUB1 homology region 1-domain-containing protein [Lenzites betulinus]